MNTVGLDWGTIAIMKNFGFTMGIWTMVSSLFGNVRHGLSKKKRALKVNLSMLTEGNVLKHHIGTAVYSKTHLQFSAIGRGPWFVIENPVPNSRIKCLSLVLSVPENTVCQVFFTNATNEAFSEAKSIKYFAVEGKNNAYFELPTVENISKIRIDPGQVVGKYCLHSIKIETNKN